MNNTLKVAKWEIQRTIKNKTFLISLFLTPLIMLLFAFIPSLLTKLETDKPFNLYIVDNLGIHESISESSPIGNINFVFSNENRQQLEDKVSGNNDQGFVILDNTALENGLITIYTDSEGISHLAPAYSVLQSALQNHKLKTLNLSDSQIEYINQPLIINTAPLKTKETEKAPHEKAVPSIFAAILYLSIFTSGMMSFQSTIQEKKDKMVELILSSIKAEELMRGKILGYFALGMVQVGVWLIFGIPIAQTYFKIPVLQYLLVPEIIPMAFFALAGYLMFSSIFVAIGATLEDAESGSSFQGIIFLIPMLPIFFIGPAIANPSGIIALVGTYFPLTAPGVMLVRLSISDNIPYWEVLLSALILMVTIMLIMRLAGKLFKIAILMYGKNASFTEIIKWLRY